MTVAQHIQVLTFIGLFFLTACTHPISEQTRAEINPQTTLAMVKAEPDAFIDKQLLLGGVIIAAEMDKEGTMLELMKWHLNRFGEPTYLEEEGRRFLVKSKQSLDPAIYEPGVLVTLAGTVLGEETRLLDEHEYVYPVFEVNEIHPWNSPFRYGIHRVHTPDYPYYVGQRGYANRNPYDPGYSVYPYTQYWYGPAVYQSRY
jgi:outer membrane lipoprotein